MKTIKRIGLAIALAPLLSAMPVHANFLDNAASAGGDFFEDVYYGGAFGQSEADGYCGTSANCNNDDTTWKVYGGYKINDMFDAEVSYNSIGDISREGDTDTETAEISTVAISAVGKYQINDSVEALGKIGATRWASSSDDGDRDGVGLSYGFGAKVYLNESMKLRAEWESISDVETTDGRETDITTMTLGIELETL